MTTKLKLIRPTEKPNLIIAPEDEAIPTLAEVFESYVNRKKLKPNTLANYRINYNAYLADWHGLRLNKITRKMISDRHLEISAMKVRRGKGEASADQVCRLLRSLFNFAVALWRDQNDEPLITSNPVAVLNELGLWNQRIGRRTFLKGLQLHKLWRASGAYSASKQCSAADATARDWVRLVLLTGFRRDEARLLKWEQVDFTDGTITLPTTKNGMPHTIPITRPLLKVLADRKSTALPHIDYIFPHSSGQNLPVAKNCRAIDAMSIESGIKFGFHDLRRSYINACHRAGLTEVAIKMLVNHRSSINHDVTYKSYLSHDIEPLRGPAERVAYHIMQACESTVETEKPRIRLKLKEVTA